MSQNASAWQAIIQQRAQRRKEQHPSDHEETHNPHHPYALNHPQSPSLPDPNYFR